MKKLTLIFLATCAASINALAAFSTSNLVALRFVTAAEARSALEKNLGAEAVAAVRGVDSARNGLLVDGSHPQAAKVREFLVKFDQRQEEVMVSAVITRHVEAADGIPAHEKVIARPTIYSRAGQPVQLVVPSAHGETKIELQITPIPAATK